MLAITWSSYLLYYALVALVYWLLAGLILYRKEIFTRHLRYVSSSPAHETMNPAESGTGSDQMEMEFPGSTAVEDQGEVAQNLSDEIEAFFAALQGEEHIDKKSVLDHLRRIIAKYPSLRMTPYPSGINQLIIQQCHLLGTGNYSIKEIQQLWMEG